MDTDFVGVALASFLTLIVVAVLWLIAQRLASSFPHRFGY
jgi:uncharacterized protein YggT (Ycf19 family)